MAALMGAAAVRELTVGRATDERVRIAQASIVAAITLVGLALRIANLDQSLFGDELFAYYEIVPESSLDGVVVAVRHGPELNPPLYFLVAWLANKLGGDPFVLLRLPSIVAGTLAIPIVYMVGIHAVGRRAALVATALFALSPFAIFYSTEARPYSLMGFFVLVSTLALLRAVSTRKVVWWIVTGAGPPERSTVITRPYSRSALRLRGRFGITVTTGDR